MLRHWWNAFLLVILRAFLIALIALRSFFTRTRMSHQNGIVARGRVRIVDNPLFPENDFFRPGVEFPCRLRHASVSQLDDAGLYVRGATLKFADQDVESPLDILMNGGTTSPFWNVWTFLQFTFARIRGGRAKTIPYFQKNPRCFENVVSALRLHPSSFSQLHYYSQTPLEFRAADEKLRYIKFRLMPDDRSPESGIPDAKDLMTPWFQEARPGDALSPNYLKDEFRERVQTRGVTYHLQMQLHEWMADDRREVILNSLYEWDEAGHPWMDVATVRLDAILADEHGYNCAFPVTNLPGCIRLIKPLSIYDPPSLEYLRVGSSIAHRARFLGTKIFGPPPAIPDKRPAASYPDEMNNTVTAADVYMAATLPQNESKSRLRERQQQLEVARGLYQFETEAGLPSYVKLLPEAEKFTPEKDWRMRWDVVGTVADLSLAAVESVFEPRKGLHAYESLYPLLDKPGVIERFRTDEEFGRQRLAGINPFLIRRCEAIPGHFRVDDATLAGLLGEGVTLASAMASGRIYLIDYGILEGIPVKQGRYVCAPLCLLHVDPSGKLMPLAIQLGQSPDAGPTFTPKDEFWLWQTVKTHVQCADAQVQEAVSHLLCTHLVIETFAVSAHRQLSVGHPVFQLLAPHLHFTMAINSAARNTMLAPDGPIDRVMALGREGTLALIAKAWNSDWSFARYDLDADLRARGVDDPALLPNYHYRDDALPVWGAIEEFVTAILRLFYKGDADVAHDWELQAWACELADPDIGKIRGFPGNGRLDTFDQLSRLLTTIIFTASAAHSSTNNGQYEMYGYMPNVPGAMYCPPPTTKQALTEASLVEALPGALASAAQIAMVHLLSEPAVEPFGRYEPEFFAGTPVVEQIVLRFNRQLDEISRSIDARNHRIDVPYTYLDPAHIYQSIEI